MRILVIEPDELTAEVLVSILSHQNYAVEVTIDGQTGWELIDVYPYDLLIIETHLPDMQGVDLCQKIRSHHYQTPVILLTDHSSGHDKAIGLDAGADDYIVKPFDWEELSARVRALLRRSSITASPVLEWENLRFDPTSCEVTYAGKPLALTAKECALLELFLRNQRRVFNCNAILEHLWAYEEMPGEEAVRTHIKGLRQKLKAVGCPAGLIETVYGIGYRLRPASTQKKMPDPGSPGSIDSHREIAPRNAPSSCSLQSSHEQVLQIMENVWDWQRNKLSWRVKSWQ
ncbi:response regulator transcription factor [Egbenema bharatensis]|uniref:response regulator transcription factor n=1 Tax=Egbenema bharatensis TaxID=3463334 RepID=UPI003A870984